MQSKPLKISRIERKCDICEGKICKGQKYGMTRKYKTVFCEKCTEF